jgi:hypothetical protein
MQAGTSWAQDNPCSSGFQKTRDFHNAHGRCKLVMVKQYSQAVVEIATCHMEASIFDPQQLKQELKYLRQEFLATQIHHKQVISGTHCE